MANIVINERDIAIIAYYFDSVINSNDYSSFSTQNPRCCIINFAVKEAVQFLADCLSRSNYAFIMDVNR